VSGEVAGAARRRVGAVMGRRARRRRRARAGASGRRRCRAADLLPVVEYVRPEPLMAPALTVLLITLPCCGWLKSAVAQPDPDRPLHRAGALMLPSPTTTSSSTELRLMWPDVRDGARDVAVRLAPAQAGGVVVVASCFRPSGDAHGGHGYGSSATNDLALVCGMSFRSRSPGPVVSRRKRWLCARCGRAAGRIVASWSRGGFGLVAAAAYSVVARSRRARNSRRMRARVLPRCLRRTSEMGTIKNTREGTAETRLPRVTATASS
jgi:hypothetical protein